MSDDRQQRVKQRAYEIWESEGRPSGRHDDHWNRADRELGEQDQGRSSGAIGGAAKGHAKRGATKRTAGAAVMPARRRSKIGA
jgi:hypothetical protein